LRKLPTFGPVDPPVDINTTPRKESIDSTDYHLADSVVTTTSQVINEPRYDHRPLGHQKKVSNINISELGKKNDSELFYSWLPSQNFTQSSQTTTPRHERHERLESTRSVPIHDPILYRPSANKVDDYLRFRPYHPFDFYGHVPPLRDPLYMGPIPSALVRDTSSKNLRESHVPVKHSPKTVSPLRPS